MRPEALVSALGCTLKHHQAESGSSSLGRGWTCSEPLLLVPFLAMLAMNPGTKLLSCPCPCPCPVLVLHLCAWAITPHPAPVLPGPGLCISYQLSQQVLISWFFQNQNWNLNQTVSSPRGHSWLQK